MYLKGEHNLIKSSKSKKNNTNFEYYEHGKPWGKEIYDFGVLYFKSACFDVSKTTTDILQKLSWKNDIKDKGIGQNNLDFITYQFIKARENGFAFYNEDEYKLLITETESGMLKNLPDEYKEKLKSFFECWNESKIKST